MADSSGGLTFVTVSAPESWKFRRADLHVIPARQKRVTLRHWARHPPRVRVRRAGVPGTKSVSPSLRVRRYRYPVRGLAWPRNANQEARIQFTARCRRILSSNRFDRNRTLNVLSAETPVRQYQTGSRLIPQPLSSTRQERRFRKTP